MNQLIISLVFVVFSLLIVYLLLHYDKGEKEPTKALFIAAGFGLMGIVVAYFIEHNLFLASNLTTVNGLGSLFINNIWIGAIEEACKFIPLAIYIYRKPYFNAHIDGIIYFAIAGLSFGLPENILYTINYGSSVGISRLILTPIFHASLTGMVGYFLAKFKVEHNNPWKVIYFFLLAIALHAIYDFGLLSGNNDLSLVSVTITLLLSISLFYLYIRATDLDRSAGLSAVGNNKYCRNCGKINKMHHIYCVYCGTEA